MIFKKPQRKTVSRSRLSLVSPSLDGALRGTMQMAPPQEPWRDHKRKGNKRGKRKK
jgi:hypothetical protein